MPLSIFDPRVMLGALLFLLAWSGIGGYLIYNRGADDNEAAHVAQDLAETKLVLTNFTTAAKEMNGIAGQFTAASQTLSTEIDAISGKFRNVTRANPLPLDCKPDPFRVQSLSSAITATNSAIGRGAGPAVPAH